MSTDDPFKIFQGQPKHSSPHPRDYFSHPQSHHQGATIGDGMKSSAKIAAAMTGMSLLLQSGPVILAGLAGLLFCCRGCMLSVPPPIAPSQHTQHAITNQQAIPPQFAPPARATEYTVPLGQPLRTTQVRAPVTVPPIGSGAAIFEEVDQSPLFVVEDEQAPMVLDPSVRNAVASAMTTGAVPQVVGPAPNPLFQPNTAINANLPPTFGAFMPPTMIPPQIGSGGVSFMQNIITNSPAPNASTDAFSFQKGRKFTGTSQMPGEPSVRVQLSIMSVKDRGTNVSARLSSLEGRRFSRNYNGLIETNPLRLTLIPEAQSNGFGTFVTYSSWTSNSPTRISLTINTDKGLSGSSGSGEVFELVGELDSFAANVARKPSIFGGFDSDENGDTCWALKFKNGQPVTNESWRFSSEAKSFSWMRGDTVIAKGSFIDSVPRQSLDLTIVGSKANLNYACLFYVLPESTDSIRVCVPKNAGDKRPSMINAALGNVFDLECVRRSNAP